MSELQALCQRLGFVGVRTYIASGNVVFESTLAPAQVKSALESALLAHTGKPVGVLVRTAEEMAAVLAANPFPGAAPNQTVAIFLDDPPVPTALDTAVHQRDEQLRLGAREIYVHYPSGMGASKLGIPAARQGTARNMNTTARLLEMARQLQS